MNSSSIDRRDFLLLKLWRVFAMSSSSHVPNERCNFVNPHCFRPLEETSLSFLTWTLSLISLARIKRKKKTGLNLPLDVSKSQQTSAIINSRTRVNHQTRVADSWARGISHLGRRVEIESFKRSNVTFQFGKMKSRRFLPILNSRESYTQHFLRILLWLIQRTMQIVWAFSEFVCKLTVEHFSFVIRQNELNSNCVIKWFRCCCSTSSSFCSFATHSRTRSLGRCSTMCWRSVKRRRKLTRSGFLDRYDCRGRSVPNGTCWLSRWTNFTSTTAIWTTHMAMLLWKWRETFQSSHSSIEKTSRRSWNILRSIHSDLLTRSSHAIEKRDLIATVQLDSWIPKERSGAIWGKTSHRRHSKTEKSSQNSAPSWIKSPTTS